MTRILAIGDVVAKAGRLALSELLPLARKKFNPDFVILNGENAAGGHGISTKIYDMFLEQLGIDCITMGNHWHDHKDIFSIINSKTHRIVLPGNMSNIQNELSGIRTLPSRDGRNVVVANVIGKVFMKGENRCPFKCIDRVLNEASGLDKIRVLDIHAEASSEKQALARYVEGKLSLVYGTHSHVPSADERILGSWTGFTTDIGMTGAYESVIGIDTKSAIHRLLTGEKKNFRPSEDDPWMCFVIADIEASSGKCINISRHRWELKQIDFLSAEC